MIGRFSLLPPPSVILSEAKNLSVLNYHFKLNKMMKHGPFATLRVTIEGVVRGKNPPPYIGIAQSIYTITKI